MSTPRAIAAVTERLVEILKDTGANVSAKPPDKAGSSQLNVFLYHASIDATWRNQDLPRPAGRGQPARPLLPLNLYYLISAISADDDVIRHNFLGKAMLKLHDISLEDSLQFRPESGIKNQPDSLRITLQPLNLDEMYKLWSVFQVPFRPSVAYEVGVVLIESELPESLPLPVTRRGPDSTGWDATTQFPASLTSVEFETKNQPGASLGETVTLKGQNLKQLESTKVHIRHPLLEDSIVLDPLTLDPDELQFQIPNEPDKWPAGIYMVSVQNDDRSGHEYRSNAVPFGLLPQIEVPAGGLKVAAQGDSLSLTLKCKTRLITGQRVQILIGSVLLEGDFQNASTTVKATWKKASVKFPGNETHIARLRVDGVDSLVYDPANPQLGFDPELEVKGLPQP
jgi:hypothetical protein